MTKARYCLPLAFLLALAAQALCAQPAAIDATDAPPDTPAPSATRSQEEAAEGAAATARNDSPFDYRASEEISEDLPVSFPVDI
ncbi:MAG: hypothetical protein HRT77_12420 [Halioglobus sp.]|nr:hypothetical protein [Halioglobus sp.]